MNINEIIQEDGLSNSINELAWSRLMGKFNENEFLIHTSGESSSIDEDKLFAFFKKYCTPNIPAITNKKPIEESVIHGSYHFFLIDKPTGKITYGTAPNDLAQDSIQMDVYRNPKTLYGVCTSIWSEGQMKAVSLKALELVKQGKTNEEIDKAVNPESFDESVSLKEVSTPGNLTVSELGVLLLNNPLLVDEDKSAIKRICLKIMADGKYLTEENLNKVISVYLSRQKSN